MLEHCDFEEQKTVAGEDGFLRPDMVVHLPGGGQVVIDSKVPLDAFLQFIEADDDEARRALLEKHAKQLRTHVDQLAKKEYWRQFERSPEFVVAFIPGEPLLAAALDADPTLQDHALDKRVILATPNTLVAALRTIALSWQQETLAENAREVKDLGAELYERLRTWTGHMQSAAEEPHLERRRLQPGGRFARVARAGHRPQVPVSRRGRQRAGRDHGAVGRSRRRRAICRRSSPTTTTTRDGTRPARAARSCSRTSCRCRTARTAATPPERRPGLTSASVVCARWTRRRQRSAAGGEQRRRTLRGCSTSTAPTAPTTWSRSWPSWWPFPWPDPMAGRGGLGPDAGHRALAHAAAVGPPRGEPGRARRRVRQRRVPVPGQSDLGRAGAGFGRRPQGGPLVARARGVAADGGGRGALRRPVAGAAGPAHRELRDGRGLEAVLEHPPRGRPLRPLRGPPPRHAAAVGRRVAAARRGDLAGRPLAAPAGADRPAGPGRAAGRRVPAAPKGARATRRCRRGSRSSA